MISAIAVSPIIIGENEQVGAAQRKLLDALGVAAVLLDARSRQILHANRVFCQSLQHKLDEILKAGDLLHFIHPDDHRLYVAGTEELVKGIVEPRRFEARYRTANDGSVRMRAVLSGLRDDAGKLIWITLVLDELAEAGRQRNDGFRRLAGDKVTIWNWFAEDDERTGDQFQILLGKRNGVKPAFLSTERIHPDDVSAVELLRQRSRRGLSGVQDYRRLVENSGVRWVREMVAPVKDAAGRLTGVIGVSVEITDDKGQKPSRKSEEILSFIEHLQTDWDKPLVLSAVARRYNVGTRSLQKYFSSLGTTPLDFLKRIRLVHAYEMLSTPGAKTTVTSVCARCGFGNLGHFARDYRTEFGELPSETLLRTRASRASAIDSNC